MNSHQFLMALLMWSGWVITEMQVVLSFYWGEPGLIPFFFFFFYPSTLLSICLYFLAFIFPLLGHIKLWVHCVPYGGHHECSMAKDDCHYSTFWEGILLKHMPSPLNVGPLYLTFMSPSVFCILMIKILQDRQNHAFIYFFLETSMLYHLSSCLQLHG